MSAEKEPIRPPEPAQTTGQPAPHRRGGDDPINQRMIDWLVWKVALPLAIFFVIWPAYKWVCGIDHPFERAFAHGDLLIFSALVLIEAVVEGEHQHGQSGLKRAGLQLAKVVAISFIMIFGFIKYDVIKMENEAHVAAVKAAEAKAAKATAEEKVGDAAAGGGGGQPRGAAPHGAMLALGPHDAAPHGGIRVKEHDNLMSKMLLYSYLNCAIAGVSVIFSVFAFWSSVKAEKDRQLELLKGGRGT